jgi:hypothetical protein
MAIDFLNDSRSYDPHRRSISFWGHDAAFEITFRLDQAVLEPFVHGHQDGHEQLDEASALMAFDENINRIRAFARNLYTRDKRNYFEISGVQI